MGLCKQLTVIPESTKTSERYLRFCVHKYLQLHGLAPFTWPSTSSSFALGLLISYHIISYHITSHHITLHHIISNILVTSHSSLKIIVLKRELKHTHTLHYLCLAAVYMLLHMPCWKAEVSEVAVKRARLGTPAVQGGCGVPPALKQAAFPPCTTQFCNSLRANTLSPLSTEIRSELLAHSGKPRSYLLTWMASSWSDKKSSAFIQTRFQVYKYLPHGAGNSVRLPY